MVNSGQIRIAAILVTMGGYWIDTLIFQEAGRIVQAEQLKINSQTCWVCSEIRIFFCVVSRTRSAAVTTPSLDPKINLGCFGCSDILLGTAWYCNRIFLGTCSEKNFEHGLFGTKECMHVPLCTLYSSLAKSQGF